MLKDEDFGFKK